MYTYICYVFVLFLWRTQTNAKGKSVLLDGLSKKLFRQFVHKQYGHQADTQRCMLLQIKKVN